MPERITAKRIVEFETGLQELGGSSGNGRLRERLGWDEEFYWRVQGRLVEENKIIPGRGKGGSVRFSETETEPTDEDCGDVEQVAPRRHVERPLYEPIKYTMESKWLNRFGFHEFLVESTHSQGSRRTGGTFTRPDITVVGVRRYEFLPKRIEVVTFEIKPAESIGIMGVLEAVAHKEAAHLSYVLFATSRAHFDASNEADRIVELAQKFGIGVILAENPAEVSTWEVSIDAMRHEPDPARLDRFMGDLPDTSKKLIHKLAT